MAYKYYKYEYKMNQMVEVSENERTYYNAKVVGIKFNPPACMVKYETRYTKNGLPRIEVVDTEYIRPKPPVDHKLKIDIGHRVDVDVDIGDGAWRVGTVVAKSEFFYEVKLDNIEDVRRCLPYYVRRHFDWHNGLWVLI
ncbi:uncharacterized protein LOC126674743 [Mercurialis annua]|uniref:uncharacterized protein LOC126674743 n=1 Tax=Mercurialis annua TaxID=3986 RepID=UPI00215EC40E|nr:uncharacterized protein LOC126674743 [Mercurialis annua]